MVLLILGGALIWSQERRGRLVVDASNLDELPSKISMWREQAEVPLTTKVEEMLRADFNLQRVYWHPVGGRIDLYVGYYGTERGGRPEHTPEVCYPSAGWEIVHERIVDIDRSRGLRANEFLVALDGHTELVQFWYRTYRRTGLLGGMDQILDRMIGRLTDGRSDGALVRVSTVVQGGDDTAARSRLIAFGAALDRLFDRHWPVERFDVNRPESAAGLASRD